MKPARVLIAHNRVEDGADPSTADVLDQVALVRRGLEELEIPFEVVPVAHGRVWDALAPAADTVVFNLLEAPPGAPYLQPASAAVLEILRLPFTGSPPSVLWLTTDKLATRATLAACGLPVAPGGRLRPEDPGVLERVPGPWILKPAWEDASVGLDGDPVCRTRAAVQERGRLLARRFPGQPILAEHFLPGREVNVGLLERDGAVEVLPIAEIEFVDFPAGMAPLVGYEAKWDTGSFADTHTRRRFPDPEEEHELLDVIRALARLAWDACDLAGYARVDMRLDEHGQARILEVNANPCLSAGAGFMAAAERAGLSSGEVVRRIIGAALRLARRRQGA